jgi:hypothetical protein
LEGKSWDVIEVFCSKSEEDMKYKSNTSYEDVSPITEHEEKSEISNKGGGPSEITTALIVIGVLLVCALGGGLILVKVVKRLRNKPKTPEYWDVYGHRATYVSIQSYADVGSRPSYVSVQSYADVGSEPSHISVQSYADIGSDRSNSTGYTYVAVQ